VEDALVAFLQSQHQARSLAQSVVEARRAVELVLLQYQGGVTDFNRVFNAQSTLVTQQDQLAVTEGDIALRLIDVYRSLGGGWRYFLGAPEPPQIEGAPAGAAQPPAEEVPLPPQADAPEPPPASAPGPKLNGPAKREENAQPK
jgi:hypothetical protein